MDCNSLNVNSNVNIKSIDIRGNILRDINIHNRATVSMIDGILGFLRGVFTPSEYNEYENNSSELIASRSSSAISYIPSCVCFGDIGIRYSEGKVYQDLSQEVEPAFYDDSLQHELEDNIPRVKFSRIRQLSGSSIGNSEEIVLTTVLPTGYLLYKRDENGEIIQDSDGTKEYRDDVFTKDGKKYCMLTEFGLSSRSEGGKLLARVLLDGEISSDGSGDFIDENYEFNPVVQSEDNVVIIEWRIGVVSVSDKDKFINLERKVEGAIPTSDTSVSSGKTYYVKVVSPSGNPKSLNYLEGKDVYY